MNKIFSILCIVLQYTLLVAQQATTIDTLQYINKETKNTAWAKKQPYVILISADGFRFDYAEKYGAREILNLAQSGVRAASMVPSYPSITGPNHYTLITGMYPSHTGFVGNSFFDRSRNDYFSMSQREKIADGTWLHGKPLWTLAEEHGMVSASLFWVASNSTAGGTRPTYYYNYHETFSNDRKIQIVREWLQLPEERRPHFITLYFPEADKAGHFYGPESKEVKDAVLEIDRAVGKLRQTVEEVLPGQVNLIFVSDHGMIDVDTTNPLPIPDLLLDKNLCKIFNDQTLLRVMLNNPRDADRVYRQLKPLEKGFKVYKAKNFIPRLYFATRDDVGNRLGELYLVPEVPKIFLANGETTKKGKHGYDPTKVKEMHAVFYAAGPAFKKKYLLGSFQNIHLYPLVAEVLGLTYTHQIDGKKKVLKKILSTSK